MDQTTLLYILGIAGSIIVILLGAVAYFIKQWVITLEDLKKMVHDLRTFISSQKVDLSNFRSHCAATNQTTVKRLDAHAKRLDDHSDRIAIIETQIK